MNETILTYAVIVTIIFYAAIPLAGAFSVRRKWRFFRAQVIEASISREVSYSNPDRKVDGSSGRYCFIGDLQAIQDDSSIWLNNGKVSVRAEMKDVKLYLLPTSRSIENEDRIEENNVILPQDMPKRIKWERVYSLTQGTGVVLSGQVYVENGTPVFRNTEEQPLLVIIYDGKKESILRRSIWTGRQLNEFWNNLTPLSLITGSFFLFVLTFFSYRQFGSDTPTILAAVMSFIPLLPFLPPGIVLYFIFRRLWRSGRYLRGERDLLRLPLRYPEYDEYASCREALRDFPDAKLRSCGIIDEDEVMSIPCRLFSSAKGGSEPPPRHFFEELIIPGDPEELAWKCRSRARKMEILAAASISLGFVVNGLLFYFVLIWFL
ncbi:MAG TPA: hypothetical protein DCO79_00900 [Spirochaeta sp.]|nr:hypothetical protein [Spirochaeta sp.]